MNAQFGHRQFPPRNTNLACVTWLLFCMFLWTTGIILCVKIIDALYFQ
jgi:hypothetical protein